VTPADAGRAAFDPDRFLEDGRELAERALAALPLDELPASLRPVVDYAVHAGGKRLRPILCMAAYRAVQGADAPAPARRAAASLELIHAYSLVHDDLPFMDDDDLRRGRPTTHRAHGVATATVAGAAMVPLALEALRAACAELGLDAERTREALGILARGAGQAGMVGGQWLDLAAEGRSLSRPALERIHALKTGALITAAAVLGGALAGADSDTGAALDTYGRAIGLAFQIADDLLDEHGDPGQIGKTGGRDAALAKSTYPALLGVEGAERLARAEVERGLRALAAGHIESPELEAIARYAVERRS
jgi:geranylgeranyl pyrophosphate synthase